MFGRQRYCGEVWAMEGGTGMIGRLLAIVDETNEVPT